MSKYKSKESKRVTTTTNEKTVVKKSDSILTPVVLLHDEKKRKNIVVGVKEDETTTKSVTNDWISELTKKIVATDDVATSKNDRIATRNAKRQRKLMNEQQQDNALLSSTSASTSSTKVERINKKNQQIEEENQYQLSIMKNHTQSQLQTISDFINNLVTIQRTNNPKWKKQLFQRDPSLYNNNSSKSNNNNIINGTINDIIKNIQPRTNDYGGIGLARQSLFISFNDPSYIPQIQKEFKEHIIGFFGKKHKSKIMKKYLSQTMLWKQLQNNKKNSNNTSSSSTTTTNNDNKNDSENNSQNKKNLSKNKKKINKMTTDERVELLLKTNSKII